MNKRIFTPLVAFLLALSLSATALADTIRLKDGSVIRGQVIAFNNQQFTVLVGTGSRGRRSQITLWMEDVESIEFESAGAAGVPVGSGNTDMGQTSRPPVSTTTTTTRPPVQQQPVQTTSRPQPDDDDDGTGAGTQPAGRPQPSSQGSTAFFTAFNSRVRGDNTANGWTYTGFSVKKGQRIRITARGSIMLGGGRVSTPVGISGLQDNQKLMPAFPTGALIAVIGDDNDDFIHVGGRREFIAQRDGGLFLGINEGNLSDNTGNYEVLVEAEVMGGNR